MLKPFILCIAAAVLIACKTTHTPPIQAQPTTQTRSLSFFDKVKVTGELNVTLHTGYKKPAVIIKGDQRDLAFLTVVVVNNTLQINLNKGYPQYGLVSLDIRAPALYSFVYKGRGLIKGTRLSSSSLDLFINNPGKTILGGHVALRNVLLKGDGLTQIQGVSANYASLTLSGKSRLQMVGVTNLHSLNIKDDAFVSLYWIKSKYLTVHGKGKSYIQLAGVVDKMEVELCDHAHFNGRYLRVHRAFVKTHDNALAELSTVDHQHTLATDKSNIFFYNIPQMRTDFMACNGAVLDMRDWNYPFLQEYDRYNKYSS